MPAVADGMIMSCNSCSIVVSPFYMADNLCNDSAWALHALSGQVLEMIRFRRSITYSFTNKHLEPWGALIALHPGYLQSMGHFSGDHHSPVALPDCLVFFLTPAHWL